MNEVVAWLSASSPAITAAATLVPTATTIVYAWLTGILALENRRLRRAGTEPLVIAYLFPDAQNLAIEFEAAADRFKHRRLVPRPPVRTALTAACSPRTSDANIPMDTVHRPSA